jgi:HK97 family phage portal protein
MRGIFGAVAAGLPAGGQAKSVGFDSGWAEYFGGVASKTGISVTTEKALKATTLLAGTRVLAEDIAQCPWRLLRRDGDRTLQATEHPLYELLHDEPNDWMTSFEFRETLMFHAVLAKGGYAYINRLNGKVRELLPLCGRVELKQGKDWDVYVEAYDKDGLIGTFPKADIFQIRGPSWNGFEGMDVVQLAREAIGLALAAEESHARFHANSTRPAGILSIDASLSQEARDRIKKQAQEQAGILNAGKTLVLDKGADWKAMAMSGVDSQHIETRRFQIEEMCRPIRVFPQMVGHTDKTATFASAEAFFEAHKTYSLAPWAVRWDGSTRRDLISRDDRRAGIYAKIDLNGLVRGDFKTRMEGYSRALGSGGSPAWMTQDEVRRLEDLDPMGGDAAKLPPFNPSGGKPAPKDPES